MDAKPVDKKQLVAHEVVAVQNDNGRLVPMLDKIRRNTRRNPVELSADRGYFSEANFAALRRRKIRGYIAIGKELDSRAPSRKRAAARGPLAKQVRRRIKPGGFRSRCRLRKQIVEPRLAAAKSSA